MKHLTTLKLNKKFKNMGVETFKNQLIKDFGSNNEQNYIKHWLTSDYNDIYVKQDSESLALYEYTNKELEELKSESNTSIERIDNVKPYFEHFARISKYFDFEENKYNYYSVCQNHKNYNSIISVRVIK